MGRLLARKVDSAPAVVVATYRDDELELRHPLRVVLGEPATAHEMARCELPRLSPDTVAQLAEPHGIDAGELFSRTAGNPFFLSEVLAGGDRDVPPTVRDAVLARTAPPSSPTTATRRSRRCRRRFSAIEHGATGCAGALVCAASRWCCSALATARPMRSASAATLCMNREDPEGTVLCPPAGRRLGGGGSALGCDRAPVRRGAGAGAGAGRR